MALLTDSDLLIMAYPRVTEILRYSGVTDFSAIPAATLEYAQTRGTAVHSACHFLDEEDLDWSTLDPAIEGYVRAWERFKSESGFVPDMIEQSVYCPTYQYRGTLDRTGTMGDKKVLIDIKTGPPGPSAALQTAAYAACLTGTFARYAVHVREDGSYKLHSYTDRNDIAIFRSYIATMRWEQNNKIKRRAA